MVSLVGTIWFFPYRTNDNDFIVNVSFLFFIISACMRQRISFLSCPSDIDIMDHGGHYALACIHIRKIRTMVHK